jgi:hypothetical protein
MKSSGRLKPSGRRTRTSTLPSTVHMVRLLSYNIMVHVAVNPCCSILVQSHAHGQCRASACALLCRFQSDGLHHVLLSL